MSNGRPMFVTPSVSSRPRNLVMIGTVHMDRDSAPELASILKDLMPAQIGVETSPFSIAFRRDQGRALRYRYLRFLKERGIPPMEGGELSWRIRLLSMPYEYVCARLIGRRYGIVPSHLSRNRESMAGLMPLSRESNDNRHLLFLSGTKRNVELEILEERRRATLMKTSSDISSVRERILARNIRRLSENKARVVVILGWEHMAPNIDGNAMSLVSDLYPVGILVNPSTISRIY